MAHRRKKIEKKRGTRTCGYGGRRKRRGKGFRGGSGNSGVFKHRKSWFIKNDPGHAGKHGFTPRSDKCLKEVRVINLSELDRLSAGKSEINLSELGYDKVLGMGAISRSITVTAAAFSKHAKEKIEEAGGKAIAEGESSE